MKMHIVQLKGGGGGGGAMLFHAFRAGYPVKELDYHAKHRQKKKKIIQLDV